MTKLGYWRCPNVETHLLHFISRNVDCEKCECRLCKVAAVWSGEPPQAEPQENRFEREPSHKQN